MRVIECRRCREEQFVDGTFPGVDRIPRCPCGGKWRQLSAEETINTFGGKECRRCGLTLIYKRVDEPGGPATCPMPDCGADGWRSLSPEEILAAHRPSGRTSDLATQVEAPPRQSAQLPFPLFHLNGPGLINNVRVEGFHTGFNLRPRSSLSVRQSSFTNVSVPIAAKRSKITLEDVEHDKNPLE